MAAGARDLDVPPAGTCQMSYSRFLQLLHAKQICRITFMLDGKAAIVEAAPPESGKGGTMRSREGVYAKNMWANHLSRNEVFGQMFWVFLPGDFWETTHFAALLEQQLPQRTTHGYAPAANLCVRLPTPSFSSLFVRTRWLLRGQCADCLHHAPAD